MLERLHLSLKFSHMPREQTRPTRILARDLFGSAIGGALADKESRMRITPCVRFREPVQALAQGADQPNKAFIRDFQRPKRMPGQLAVCQPRPGRV